jgi:hypothetical protein
MDALKILAQENSLNLEPSSDLPLLESSFRIRAAHAVWTFGWNNIQEIIVVNNGFRYSQSEKLAGLAAKDFVQQLLLFDADLEAAQKTTEKAIKFPRP